MKRLTVSLLLCVCLTLLLIPTVSFGATKAANVEPNATRDYSFKVLVPNFGTTYFPVNYNPSDPSTYYIMSPGKYVIVQRTDSVKADRLYFAPLMQAVKHRWAIG